LRQRLKSDGDLGKDRAESTVLWRLLGKIESTYEQFEFDRSRADALRLVNPQRLDASSAQYAREVSAHLKKAAAKVRRIQRTTETSKFEMEIYRSILESAIQHFDEMSESNAAATLREAA
jgi:division protein CdvB (Snf7/Vps24/ESCRT-III family)